MTFKNDSWTNVLTMLEKVVQIIWVEDRSDSIRTKTVALEAHFAESENNSELNNFSTNKPILIFMPSTNDNYTKVL